MSHSMYIFPVHDVEARLLGNGGVHIRFLYPEQKVVTNRRMPPAPEYGISVMEHLLAEGYARIADAQHPLRPTGCGAVYILEDGNFFSPRRTADAPTHRLHHGLQAGFPENERQTTQLNDCAKKEGAEILLTTRDREPWLIVPLKDKDMRRYIVRAAGKINLKYRGVVTAEFAYEDGRDVVEVHDRSKVHTFSGYFSFVWDDESGSGFMQPFYIGFDPKNIVPHDAETRNDGIHLQRETFVFRPDKIAGKRFGDKLDKPKVYVTRNGRAKLQAKEPENAPYIFKPDNDLASVLYGLGVWEGNWIQDAIDKLKAGKHE